jgi:hypothetical protein
VASGIGWSNVENLAFHSLRPTSNGNGLQTGDIYQPEIAGRDRTSPIRRTGDCRRLRAHLFDVYLKGASANQLKSLPAIYSEVRAGIVEAFPVGK